MGSFKSSKLPFQLEGRLLELVKKDGYKVRGLRLATATGELYIKLSKEARASCRHVLTPGDWLQLVGTQSLDYEDGTIKFKAVHIGLGAMPLVQPPGQTAESVPPAPAAKRETVKSKPCILVCQKSDCCKRGGKAVMAALQAELGDRQLDEHVTIKGTGCMKQCKAGPHVVMPDKTRYTRIRPDEVAHVVDRHFPTSVKVHSTP
ncbi:(2Fe-2S) ferredoxin domain-containing protein [Leptolyngbya sp. AN02str]|uniref:(2Fe-2S) ferredoxin domain-containing protein n=1 Tax=Leptolyngbya sp. AN02str TaxID=3423363 RepID=UPI003D31553A